MSKIIRTYPTPDTQRPNCGPRERAMAVFKYLMGIEPEEAVRHPKFSIVVEAFECARRTGAGEPMGDIRLIQTADIFREIMGMQPGAAREHRFYELIERGLEQQSRLAAGQDLLEPLAPEMRGEQSCNIQLPPR